MKTLSISHQISVRFNEVDSLGIVWHGHYISYFEEAREAFGKQFGISYLDIKKEGFAVPIVRTSTEQLRPLKYGDMMTVEVSFINTRAAKIIFNYRIKNEAGEIICKGETVQVFTAVDTGDMSLSNPEFFKNWKRKHDLLDD
ncbi:MAG: acyl-CoA thioesterase [Aquaticitalea sp.]